MRGRAHRARRLATLLVALGAAVAAAGSTAYGNPSGAATPVVSNLAAVEQQVQTLYRQAEAAGGRAYAASQAVTAQEHAIVGIARQIVAAQDRTAQLQARIGDFAAAEYRGAYQPSPALQLLLSRDPEKFLQQAPVTQQAETSAAQLYSRLRQAQAQAQALGQQATDRLQQLQNAQAEAEKEGSALKSRLAQAQALLDSLQARQRARLQTVEDDNAYSAQVSWERTMSAAALARTDATPAARAAIAYAVAQIGKPYVWGAAGPGSFDCSGLVMRAWQAAGRSIPRTSQQDWAQLPHVPLDQLRPGDLVVYFQDASHVALYVGGGAIVEAPHPGASVKPAGAGSMPVLGVVRPG